MANGLLGDSWDDPRTSMMLALASGLLGGRGNLAQNLGAGLQAALPAYQQAQKMKMAQEYQAAQIGELKAQADQRRAQLEAMQAEAQRQAMLRDYLGGIGKPQYPLGSTVMTPQGQQLMQNAPKREFSAPEFFARGGKTTEIDDVLKGLTYDPNPIKHWDKGTLPGQSGEQIVGFRADGTPVKTGVVPRPQQPAVQVSVGDKDWMKSIVGAVEKSAVSAEGAASTISTLSRIRDAVASGANIGPGATFSQFGGQLLVKAGMAGKDEAEKVANTRALIQALAQTDLDLAKTMVQGQGAVSNFEREAISKAALGGIDSLTQPEFAAVISGLEKTQRRRIAEHQRKIRSLPPQLGGPAGLGNFFNVDMPPPLEPIPVPDTTIRTPGQSTRRINNPVQWGQ